MARRTAAEKADTHERIVARAARVLRARGTGVGIADIMDEVGLTHGGFYRHFGKKDDLVAEAFVVALDEMADRLVAAAESAAPGRACEAIIRTYLSPEHLAAPETWCAIASIGGDIGRAPVELRARLQRAMTDYGERLAPFMPGAGDAERRRTFLVLISGMAGAISMVRIFPERAMREGALEMIRETYLATYAPSAVDKE